MEEIALDAQAWGMARDFYCDYFAGVGAPKWHGHNQDALWDSLTGRDINKRNPPFHIRISGTTRMGDDVREIVERFKALVCEAQAAGHAVSIELLP